MTRRRHFTSAAGDGERGRYRATVTPPATYFDTTGWQPEQVRSGGSQLIPISTPSGEFRVWTKRVGTNPDLKVLLLHGGPGASDELYEPCDVWFPRHGIEYYYYDQLGSFRSDKPEDPGLWQIDRFVDEVEQVRQALGLTRDNFVLLGQSWGGILAMEYALAHQEHLKGLVISNMMASAPLYNAYATDVLMPAMDQEILAEIKRFEADGDTTNPRYDELLMEHHYALHVCRLPLEQWPDSLTRALDHINLNIYVPMQGPSELGLSGTLSDWDRTGDIHEITVPTLVVGATHDTMDPKHMQWMSEEIPDARYLQAGGGHCSQYDDPVTWHEGVIDFVLSL